MILIPQHEGADACRRLEEAGLQPCLHDEDVSSEGTQLCALSFPEGTDLHLVEKLLNLRNRVPRKKSRNRPK